MQRYEIFWGKRESLTIIIKTDIGVWNIIRIFAGIFLKEYRRVMKKSRSFVNRLTLKVLRTVLILMIVTLAVTFIAAYRSMRGETIGRYLGMRGVVSEKISASFVRKMTDEVAAFIGDAPQADDLTMLVIRWKGQKQI